MPHLKNVAMIKDSLINYVQLNSSIMSEAKSIKKTIYDFDKVIEIINKYFDINYHNLYKEELEGLYILNARELIDGIFKNRNVSKDEKEKAISSILNTINKIYPKWYDNKYYKERYYSRGFVYRTKRKAIDKLLSKGKYKLVLEKVVK